MTTLAYPYPNLFPYIESKCLWSYSIDGEEHKEFKESGKRKGRDELRNEGNG